MIARHKHTWPNLIWQPSVAIIFVLLVLFVMGHFASGDVLWAVGAGSLSSSSYIVFGQPSNSSGEPKKIVGGYLVGILTGFILRILIMQIHNLESSFPGTSHFYFIGFIAAISVGICLFFMALLRLEHPPAAGMALVLVIDMHDYNEIVIVIMAAFLLALIRRFLSKQLIDLV